MTLQQAISTVGLVLECRPSREGNTLIFPYTLHNASAVAAWIMDALPAAAGEAGDPSTPGFVALPEGDELIVGKLLPPLPTDRTVLFPLLPLVRHLEPGATLRSSLTLTLPIVEASAYLPDLPVREHTIAGLTSIRLLVAAWPASTKGLGAVPLPGQPDLFRLAGLTLRPLARLVEARFPVHQLKMLRRTDGFIRDPGDPPRS